MPNEPLVSIIVPAYRQEKYIRQAVQSAFAQTYPNLEIILSDDASPDRTFDIMVEEANRYKGSHKIVLNRNPKNLGYAANLNKLVQLASGALFIEQDGDDISIPTRSSKLVQRWLSDNPHPDLVYSDAFRIATDGSILRKQPERLPEPTLAAYMREEFFIAGGCVSAYSRSLFDKFGPLNQAIVYADYVLTFRALLGAGCAFVDEPLVYYRLHNESITQSTASSTRLAAARWAKHVVANEEDRLRVWDLCEMKSASFRRHLLRRLAFARLDARSSTGSRLTAIGCLFAALVTGRPNAALTFLQRDIFGRKSE